MALRPREVNPFNRLSNNALISFYIASLFAIHGKRKEISIDDIIRAVVVNPNSIVSRMLSAIGFDKEKLLWGYTAVSIDFAEIAKKIPKASESIVISNEIKDLLVDAYRIARQFNHIYVGTEHLFLASLKRKTKLVNKLSELGISEQSAKRLVLDFISYPEGILTGKAPGDGKIPPVLRAFGDDLTLLAEKGKLDPLIGREVELEKLVNILARRKKNNALIVGEPGVGKTTLIEGLAQRISQNMVPVSLKDFRVFRINANKIVAGSNMRGDVEEKVMAILKFAQRSPNVILFFDDIHTLLSAGSASSGGSDIASILKPELTSGQIRCIGVTTTAAFRSIFEDDTAFNRRFQPVFIDEPSVKQSVGILTKLSDLLENHHKVKIEKEAVEAAVRLSDRYVSDRNLPDKAIDLLDESCATVKIIAEQKTNLGVVEEDFRKLILEKEEAINKGDLLAAQNLRVMEENMKKYMTELKVQKDKSVKNIKVVTQDVIRSVISDWTGIPVSTLTTKESSALKNLDRVLSKRVIGQAEAVKRVSEAIKRGRTGISDAERPWASFLFLGPTGVGKTELAKSLATELFGDSDRLIQIDMSELMEMHSVSKLIGSPPGYVGYKEGGQLTEKVKNNPYSVVLFDEIEKAHEDVLNILLQVLEYGHVTDGKGNKVSFKNTVIILTSNVGIDQLKVGGTVGFKALEDEKPEWDYESVKEKLLSELKAYLKPELLNRLDEILVFKPLTKPEVGKIIDILVKEFNERLADQWIKVKIDDKVRKLLLKEGFDQEYGARPLRRAIQRNLETVIADYIIENGSPIGSKRVELPITVDRGRVTVNSTG
ncbi:ATP-dependent Clp protease ATP-binding subunit [Candidatus Dojkabacteria bacterium]|nr:ATP-dependent Clp protease ATP-binding subunit [Candidatus Dojkabacteria bacterium]